METSKIWPCTTLPKSIRENVRAPSPCTDADFNKQVFDLIKDFGNRCGAGHDEILKAMQLAAGPSDVVVVLERPNTKHKYFDRFEDFVRDCDTLQAVDELVRFATKGARSIHTVTVVDAYTFKPNRYSTTPSDTECLELLGDILERKKPNVVLRCTNFLKRENLPGEFSHKMVDVLVQNPRHLSVERPLVVSLADTDTAPANVLYSFHPSFAINFQPLVLEYRLMLVCHFILAFSIIEESIEDATNRLAGIEICPKWKDFVNGLARQYYELSRKSIDLPDKEHEPCIVVANIALGILRKIDEVRLNIPQGYIGSFSDATFVISTRIRALEKTESRYEAFAFAKLIVTLRDGRWDKYWEERLDGLEAICAMQSGFGDVGRFGHPRDQRMFRDKDMDADEDAFRQVNDELDGEALKKEGEDGVSTIVEGTKVLGIRR